MKDITKLDLVPSHLYSKDFIKCPIHYLHCSFAKNVPELHNNKDNNKKLISNLILTPTSN